jgi:hypothetical protein
VAPANNHERTLGFAGICHASGDLSGVMFNYRTSACIAWQGDMRPSTRGQLAVDDHVDPSGTPVAPSDGCARASGSYNSRRQNNGEQAELK